MPEVNADAVAGFRKKGIIANPNCSTAQLVVALKPLHDKAKIKRVVVATYQSVSGAGKEAMDELFAQTKSVFTHRTRSRRKKFPKRIAFNVIPHIDVFMDDGFTKEEWKMVVETKKILDPKIKLAATCVRVPVFVGHSEAVNIEFEEPITADEARDILRNAPGCLVIDKREAGGYATPYEAAGEDATYVSRIREDPTVENGLVLWVRVGQSAQGRGAQRHPDCRMPDQPQADRGQAQGGVTTSLPHTEPATYNAFAREAGVRLAALAFREDHSRRQAALPASQCLHIARRQSIAADAPVAALDFLDRHPRHSPHVLAFDRDHGIGQLLDDLSLLILAENVLDDLNLNERHFDFSCHCSLGTRRRVPDT